ncbi:Zinc finger protein 862 [Dissostichus eleginoides]|uniref:Zinc finger protein 862 n=1 Tax=Dissostichus eleginoides TaxID=100907 RepID=A0AAD9EWM8_DISEL|nr:Zinc finger protein 862 [Dissostichus eleginoides]
MEDPRFKPWLYNIANHGMFCRFDYLDKHAATRHHQESVKAHAALIQGSSVLVAFDPVITLEHEAVIGGFKCLYHLTKKEHAHHTNYADLLELAELLGCQYFEKLKIGRTNYTSHRIIDEMLEILGTVVEEPILANISASVAIGLEVDETTDVSVKKQLDVHVRYMDKNGLLYSQFLDLVTVSDGRADTIVKAIRTILTKKNIPTQRIYGLGTDGAAVMTGRVNGAAKQLQDTFPWMVSVACAAHHLALCYKDASSGLAYMNSFRDLLQQLHLYFRNSANRTAVLQAAECLGLDNLKVKEVKDTRWLSQAMAVSNLQRNLTAVLAALAEETEHKKCPTDKGLLFQKENVNFLALKVQVPVTMACLRAIKDAGDHQPPGSFLSKLHADLDNPAGLGAFSIVHEEERNKRGTRKGLTREELWARFRSQVMDPYFNGLLESLERRFQNLDLLGAFHALSPQAATGDEANLQLLAGRFLQADCNEVLQEWSSFKQQLIVGPFKDLDQQQVMQELASELAAIGLTIPVSSVNCERDFSTLNRVKTDLRNRLQGEHLATCMRLSINGPPTRDFPFRRALELFFKTPRKIKCSQAGCQLCHHH